MSEQAYGEADPHRKSGTNFIGAAVTATFDGPKREPQVLSQLGRAEDLQAQLVSVAETLRARLEPVMRQDVPDGAASLAEVEEPVVAPIAARLRAHRQGLQGTLEALQDLLARIEI